MKKWLSVISVAAFLPVSAWSADINTLNVLSQTEFRTLSQDLGAALSYKSIMPAEPLGLVGFDVGVVVTATDIGRSSAILSKASSGSKPIGTLYLPKLQVAKGLPFGVDVAAFISSVPTTNIKLVGGELRYAVLEGNVAMPAVAVRGSFSRLSGVDQLSFDTKGLDVSVSKGFAMFTPYAGVGRVWVDSRAPGTSLSAEKFSQSKVFVGANLNLGLINLAVEADKSGGAQSYSAKMGWRF
jgi:hypothetical protein